MLSSIIVLEGEIVSSVVVHSSRGWRRGNVVMRLRKADLKNSGNQPSALSLALVISDT